MNIEYWILNYSLEISGKNMNKIYAFKATRNNIGHVALVTLLLKQIQSPVEMRSRTECNSAGLCMHFNKTRVASQT